MRLKPFMLLSGLALQLSVAPTRADLVLLLTPAVQPGVVSNEVVFTGTLINTSLTDNLYLNNIQFSFIDAAGGYLVADTNAFFANVPGILSSLETYSDVVFAIALNPATPPGQYFGIVTLQGGTNIFSLTDLASPIFEVSVPLPVLNIASSGTNLALFWPSFPADFGLQQNTNLATTNWMTVTNTMTLTNGQNQVTLSSPTGNRFYRLEHP
ncbi:MAG: hypothetical protein WBN75_12940 [Verrucomicrobiia bacterium]